MRCARSCRQSRWSAADGRPVLVAELPERHPVVRVGPGRGRRPRDRRRRSTRRRTAGTHRNEICRATSRSDRGPTRTLRSAPCSVNSRAATSTSSRRCGSRRCCWPPGCARRSACPGLTVQQTVPFRDKGEMKKMVEAAGLRTPRSMRTTTRAGCRDAAEQIGYPIIIKPIAGAGSMDTSPHRERCRTRRRAGQACGTYPR